MWKFYLKLFFGILCFWGGIASGDGLGISFGIVSSIWLFVSAANNLHEVREKEELEREEAQRLAGIREMEALHQAAIDEETSQLAETLKRIDTEGFKALYDIALELGDLVSRYSEKIRVKRIINTHINWGKKSSADDDYDADEEDADLLKGIDDEPLYDYEDKIALLLTLDCLTCIEDKNLEWYSGSVYNVALRCADEAYKWPHSFRGFETLNDESLHKFIATTSWSRNVQDTARSAEMSTNGIDMHGYILEHFFGLVDGNAGDRYHKLLDLLFTTAKTLEKTEADEQKNEDATDEALTRLNGLIGLIPVRKEVRTLTNLVRINQLKLKYGFKVPDFSYHCVFTGNPGTGKTTVARIIAEIYRDLGVLKKGHLVETDRSGLVAEYLGQTAVKTNKVIDSALDGILFIDEAYTLAPKKGYEDYGQEAIATLLKRMEDDRDRLVVIVAGYTDEMHDFINANPGLQSRFTRYIEFPDYSEEELFSIFASLTEQYGLSLSEEARLKLRGNFSAACLHKNKHFGNGRYVRNLFEKALENQANRLSAKENVSAKDIAILLPEDIA